MSEPPHVARRLTPWLVLAIGLALSLAAALFVDAAAREADQQRFERWVEVDTNLVERRFDIYEALLHAGAAHVASTPGVDGQEWALYVAGLDPDLRYPGIQGFGWAKRIEDDAAFEATMRQARPGYRVWPEAEPPLRTAIAYLEPMDRRNEAAVGYDMATDATRREAMMRAWRTGETSASGRVVLVQEIDSAKQPGFVLYAPVFVPPLATTPEEREERLRGFVFAPFRAEDLLAQVFGGQNPNLSIVIYDGPEIREDALLFADGIERGHTPQFVDSRQIDVAGRTWTLVLSSRPRFEGLSSRGLRVPIFLGGAAFSLLLFGVTASLVGARVDAERNAGQAQAAATALHQSERRFRALIEQSPLSTQIFSPDGLCIRTNRAWEQLWGLTLAQLGPYDILADPQLEESGLMPLIRDAFAGEARHLPTIAYDPPTGKYVGKPRHISAFIYPVKDADGRVQEVVLVHEDVSRRVEAEEALRQAQKLESVGVLAGGVAHDFNNLLTSIVGYTTLALRGLPPAHKARELLERVLEASDRAADLIRQLLAYSGKAQSFTDRVEVGQLVRDIEDLLRSSVSRTAALRLDLGPEPLPVQADARQLQQVLTSLVVNAGEAVADGPGLVEVVARRVHLGADALVAYPGVQLRPGDYAQIEVRDNGVGMDGETRAQAFDPFFTTKFLGRGLGLAASLGIVRGHGGAIRVDSEPGRGSTFTVVLPLAE